MIIYKKKVDPSFWKFVLEEAVKKYPVILKQKEKQKRVRWVELEAVCYAD